MYCFLTYPVYRSIRVKFSIGGGFSCRLGASEQKHAWISGGWLCIGSGAEFRTFFYRLSVPQFADGGGRTVSSSVRKGGREGGACSLRDGTTGWVRGTSHLDIMSLVSPTWSIVMCSKSTGGVHCWRHARAHDLLWWPTSSMSSPPSKLRTRRTAVGLFEDST